MESEPEHFQPLVTQVNALPGRHEWFEEVSDPRREGELPRGLSVLSRAGSRFRRSVLIALALGLISLIELGVLLLFPEPAALVVWEEPDLKPLVELP